ncbi:aminotransferase class III-fold pyridoxal phosphate-dependent enzyme [Martelella sp. HB161492]|uniref:aminotransferase class III-fold pyridoxal phosphate-dependent enzyme n=1 Tax=Martelella sp. HB161492 TaxID=2720726 RepID=UPI001FF00E9F|nr:aminotransferase class III-fold pyridoxal phosphate-dependent enzyme [Martelella sp. HB161492]
MDAIANQTLDDYWMPFTANRAFKADPRILARAEGVHYWNDRGEKLIDGVSGLFTTPAGHGRREIAEAIAAQVTALDFAPPFQFGTPGAFRLATEIARLTPDGMNKIFFGNSGSEAVESAIKIAIQYHRRRGEAQRQRIVGREKAYHGVNFAGWSVGGMVKNREQFGLGMPGVSHIRHTQQDFSVKTTGQAETGADLADDLQRQIDLYGADTIAACIVEPISGSVGILVPPKGYLEHLRKICSDNGILLIFDEVITGFGRTGKAFAAQSFGVTPDLMTMAKAITNGNIPMAAVAVKDTIYHQIVDNSPDAIEFLHGYTWSASPIACAASMATLKIYRDEDLFARAEAASSGFLARVEDLAATMPVVTGVRGYGLLAGIDLAQGEKPGSRGFATLKALYAAGAVLRVTNDTIILAPSFIMTDSDYDHLFDTLKSVLSAI